jgi:hypothetical protein
MGYTTKFAGEFKLEPTLDHGQWLELSDQSEGNKAGAPDSYCQWVPNRKGTALEWDGGEKFYYYVEWLSWLIEKRLKPWGIAISGKVTWQGEETGDVGTIEIVGGKVVATQIDLTGVELTGEEVAQAMENYRPSEFNDHFRVVRR